MGVLQTVWLFVRGFFAGRAALLAANLAPRHQLAVLQRSVKPTTAAPCERSPPSVGHRGVETRGHPLLQTVAPRVASHAWPARPVEFGDLAGSWLKRRSWSQSWSVVTWWWVVSDLFVTCYPPAKLDSVEKRRCNRLI